MYAAFRRVPVQPPAQQRIEKKLFVAPTRGWIANENLAAAKPGGALRIENFFPTQKSIRLRAGSVRFATIGAGDPVTSLFNFKTGTSERFFAANETSIYDITAPANPNVSPTPDVTGQVSGLYSTAPFATTGGNFLYAVNGTDDARLYDGTRFRVVNDVSTSTLAYDAQTGAFTTDQTITGGTSGATAKIIDQAAGLLYVQNVAPGTITHSLAFDGQTVNFSTIGQVITGGTSGAHGVFLSQVDAGATGTLRLTGVVGAFQDNELITGASNGSAAANGVATVFDDGLFKDNEAITDPITGAAVANGTLASYSTIVITGVDSADLSQVNAYRSRLYFVESGTFSAWYLPVDSLGGAAAELSLRGIFQKGGSLLFMATWSLDAGDGVDDKAVFVTTEGEAAVFEGSYPGGDDWSLVGRYELAPPMGKNCTMKAGGDLLIATREGIIPISAAITKDVAALSLSAVTKAIEPEWKKEVLARSDLPWEMLKWPSYNMAIIALPTEGQLSPYCFVVNVQTGAWTKYTGWDTRCLGLFAEWAYFGTSTGTVMKAESSGADDGLTYECVVVGQFDHLGDVGPTHLLHQMRSTFLASVPFTPKAGVSVNYVVTLPAAPAAAPGVASGNEWDVGLWDVAIWDAAGVKAVTTRWNSVGKNGFIVAPQMQITCGQTLAPDAELISLELTYEHGALVV